MYSLYLVPMASTSSFHTTSVAVHCLSSGHNQRFLVAQPSFNSLIFPRQLLWRSILVLSRCRSSNSELTAASSSSKKKKKKNLTCNDAKEGDDAVDDAFEALFRQLEEDLKNDDLPFDDGDDKISEEAVAKLERELENALGDDDAEMLSSDVVDNAEGSHDTEEDDDKEDEKPVKLRNWQLRRLAIALKAGRRKTSIKSLAAELCLDRGVVLELLREPPPDLLMMSIALPDEPTPTALVPEKKSLEIIHEETTSAPSEPGTKIEVPVHVMQHRWSAQKRLKKVQVDTLERVYKRTRRPTNAMISSIVHVTNLPQRRVVKWFEDKRAEDGVPLNHLPYQRSVPENV
ncbi:protein OVEREXPRESSOR OF CATIONIC PEROXIDASE 3 [Quillaja saponaria]|uniref:Protein OVEREXPRESSOR OF CATIONIC PEROXIDASE 3 n=1 Tax=Quillaja saponaria TaxID=32244 RepID=A0AAD7LIM9_QUISA|nr:protein OVEREXPRESSOR OF CATIONIC PEROXIDASE 3 [Quillaja saponaria]